MITYYLRHISVSSPNCKALLAEFSSSGQNSPASSPNSPKILQIPLVSPPVQVHIAPSWPIIALVSVNMVKVKNCCTNNFLRQSFQLKKSHNKSVLPGDSFRYHRELMPNNICNKYIQLAS